MDSSITFFNFLPLTTNSEESWKEEGKLVAELLQKRMGSKVANFPPDEKMKCWTRPIAVGRAAGRVAGVSGGKVKATEPRLEPS